VEVRNWEARSLPGDSIPPISGESDLAGALHEVSNALTVVLGWLDAAHSTVPAGPGREAIEVARTHARLGHHVARRAIRGEEPGDSDSQAARSLAQLAVLGVTQEAQRQGVRVQIEEQNAARVLLDNASAVQQILLNLLLNAIAFSPRGGQVTLALRHEGMSVIFTVSDEGPGIDAERARTVLSSGVSTRGGGAGVGLRYSSALARSHRGELTLVRATPGASFALRWPTDEAPSSVRHEPIAEPVLANTRILVVEDDPAVCTLLEVALGARGARVILAPTAAEFARVATGSQTFDAALIDLSPIAEDVSGALASLRNPNPRMPVILISGFASGVPPELENTVSAWVRKPFEMGELIDVLRSVINGPSSG
jgi:CheY-like chemotaxis protein